jgi:DUF1680 family protein
MNEIPPTQVKLDDPFWNPKLETNAAVSIFHQWDRLEASGCIDNFRIAAGEKQGFRAGWFFADSDATKWLDAASRIERDRHDPRLEALMDEFIALLGRAQMEDGYLFTYNQIHFPGQRWVNLQIEHELYCHGHLIEAGVSHFQATGRQDLLGIACKAADLLVRDFLNKGPAGTPGHEEVEIALLRLYEVTGHEPYHELAEHFLEQRGRDPFFGFSLVRQFASNARRGQFVDTKRKEYEELHPGEALPVLPDMNEARKPPFSQARFFLSGLNGKYFQQHAAVRRQTVPVGHAVRFGYLETAAAMMLHDREDEKLLGAMEQAWQRMVTRRMEVTGGLGALPDSEGFGRDYELNPEFAYNETCAAIASLYWNWQLVNLTGRAWYSDLFERQLYNAMLVGVDRSGARYFYNNPTASRGGITRQPWFSIPCCPSNISRTLADLGKYLVTCDAGNIWIHQYISGEINLDEPAGVKIEIKSGFPYDGKIRVKVHSRQPRQFTLWLRRPSWTDQFAIEIDGVVVGKQANRPVFPATATGYDPRRAEYIPLARTWQGSEVITIHVNMGINVLHPHRKVRALAGRVVLTRGPLVYCLESTDNPGVDIFACTVRPESLRYEFNPEILGGTGIIRGETLGGQPLLFIPYHLWGNRGESAMTVWVCEN